jgi:hypothetical protein
LVRFQAFLRGRTASLLLKTVHDFYNRNGLDVRNALGQTWKTFGDANLGGSADTIAMGEVASKASRDAVQDVLATGGTRRADAALDYIPDMASVAGGAFQPITTNPGDNDLYQMVKGNIVSMGRLIARQGGRTVGEGARGVWESITSIPGDAQRWIGGLEREIERLYGVP